MQRILPVLIVLFGLSAGTGTGYLLRLWRSDAGAAAQPDAAGHGEATAEPAHGDTAGADAGHGDTGHGEADTGADYVRLNNQFVVPVVRDGAVAAIVVLSLSLEAEPGSAERIYALEPKLRDAFLQVMFDHANSGGFDGNFTADQSLGALRIALREAARGLIGPDVRDVLMLDILRQDG